MNYIYLSRKRVRLLSWAICAILIKAKDSLAVYIYRVHLCMCSLEVVFRFFFNNGDQRILWRIRSSCASGTQRIRSPLLRARLFSHTGSKGREGGYIKFHDILVKTYAWVFMCVCASVTSGATVLKTLRRHRLRHILRDTRPTLLPSPNLLFSSSTSRGTKPTASRVAPNNAYELCHSWLQSDLILTDLRKMPFPIIRLLFN